MELVKLEYIDIEILKYISKREPIHKEDILRKFPDKKFATEIRIKHLLICEYYEKFRFPKENTSYIYEDYNRYDIYHVSEIGKKFLQDVQIEKNKNTKEYFKNLIIELMRSVFCPLLVALVTAYLTTKYLK